VRSFQEATIFLTEASGIRGEVCVLRNPDGGVTEVSIGSWVRSDVSCVLTLLHVLEFVHETALGDTVAA
jgi:hypothetical protein